MKKYLFIYFLVFTYPLVSYAKQNDDIKRKAMNSASIEDVKNAPNTDTVIVDVRQPEELQATGKLPGSINVPLPDIKHALESATPEEFQKKYGATKPNFDTPLIFSCRTGRRSAKAYKIAEQLGYMNIKNFDGGWLKWAAHLNEY